MVIPHSKKWGCVKLLYSLLLAIILQLSAGVRITDDHIAVHWSISDKRRDLKAYCRKIQIADHESIVNIHCGIREYCR